MVFTVLLAAWFVLTNHCAVAGLMRGHGSRADCPCKENRAQQHSDSHSQPGSGHQDPAPKGGSKVCCTKVDAVANGEFKFEATAPYSGILLILDQLMPRFKGCENLRPYDHGPPSASWFATVVLQRSLFSHAPPVAA